MAFHLSTQGNHAASQAIQDARANDIDQRQAQRCRRQRIWTPAPDKDDAYEADESVQKVVCRDRASKAQQCPSFPFIVGPATSEHAATWTHCSSRLRPSASTRLGVDVTSAARVAPVTDTLAINDVADSLKPVVTDEGEAAMRSACAQPFVANWCRSHAGVFEQSVQLSVFKQVVRTSQSTMKASYGNHDPLN